MKLPGVLSPAAEKLAAEITGFRVLPPAAEKLAAWRSSLDPPELLAEILDRGIVSRDQLELDEFLTHLAGVRDRFVEIGLGGAWLAPAFAPEIWELGAFEVLGGDDRDAIMGEIFDPPAERDRRHAEADAEAATFDYVGWAATWDDLKYDRLRKGLAEEIGVRLPTLDRLRHERRGSGAVAVADDLCPDVEPWPEPVDGAELLDVLAAWFARFVQMSSAAAHTTALWTALTWFVDALEVARGQAPLLIVTSPTKRGGKTRLLERLAKVVRRPLLTSGIGITASTVFRINEVRRPTLLIDEAEKLRGRDKVEGATDIITLLNHGYSTGGRVLRNEKDQGRRVRAALLQGVRVPRAGGDRPARRYADGPRRRCSALDPLLY